MNINTSYDNLKYNSGSRKKRLKALIGIDNFPTTAFWQACPFSRTQLMSPSRLPELKIWRQIGMCWYHLSGFSSAEAGHAFNRDHATVLHGMGFLIEAIESGTYPVVQNAITSLGALVSNGAVNITDGQVEAAYRLEDYMNRAHPYVFNPSKFYCSSLAIGQRMGGKAERCRVQCGGCK